MTNSHVFISHTTKDDAFVKELREALEALHVPVWVDSRSLRGGSKLSPEIEEAIGSARQFIAVLSPHTINSPWVGKEVRKALEVERARGGEGYRVIPLLLPGIEPSGLEHWFGEEPVGIRVEVSEAGGLGEALPALLSALGERLPEDRGRTREPAPRPVAELKLRLKHPSIRVLAEGQRRAAATAQLSYDPAEESRPAADSREFDFVAPLGPLEADDLRWYLESYSLWPVGVFSERARHVEGQLPRWGRELYEAATSAQSARDLLADWERAGETAERRFSVFVDDRTPEGAGREAQAAASEAASALLALPWELLHDGGGYLFHGKRPVRVRRSLAKEKPVAASPTPRPVRVLLVSPRPEDARTPYIDHRASALPLVEALEALGELVELSVLAPPTYAALRESLSAADEAGKPYHVVHFDGHGVYDRERGLGALCFEDAKDAEKVEGRASELVYASPPEDRTAGEGGGGKKYLSELLHEHRVPLVFLEACETATAEDVPTASVAATLLCEGVASVVAMSHSVLVETARRFVGVFYRQLAEGKRVGSAMLAGQQALYDDTYRGRLLGAGELRLQDWFVPVLYQEEQDPQLVLKLPPEQVLELQAQQRRFNLGDLPEPPAHAFVGRSRELLALERLLRAEPWVVVRGQGGEGKTTLAAELARWLVRTRRFRRAAFVSLEQYTDARSALDALGRQLVPGYSVANYPDFKQALQPVERALRDAPTLVVLDNMESVLPDAEGNLPPGAAPVEELLALFRTLLDASPATRLVFTTRVPMPAPFDRGRREIVLGALSHDDAVRLVSEVMKQEGLEPKPDDAGRDPEDVTRLVESVNRHARALVLLSREVARRGVRTTTDELRRLMEELHAKFPGDRENSLYASLELSLRRLPPEIRERAKALAVFHGGAHLSVLAHILDAEPEVARELALKLIEVGLGQDMGDGHLRLDPALPSYLLREIDKDEEAAMRSRWAAAIASLALFLYQQRQQDVGLSVRLTVLELPNLLALLRLTEAEASPEVVVSLADLIQGLLSYLGRSQPLAEAVEVRERNAQKLVGWGHAAYVAASAEVDGLIEGGQMRAALAAAEQLLRRCTEAGEAAYPEAPYDISSAYLRLGRVLKMGGAVKEALPLLAEARSRFEALVRGGNNAAGGMASAALCDTGDCLTELGRLKEAAATYEECVKRNEELGRQRGVAVNKVQLGTVRMYQGRYDEALAAHEDARQTFESLGEPRMVATAWHQIGMVYRNAEQYEQAERAYRRSLAISVQQQNLSSEATSLNELGNLYSAMGRPEDAVKCHRQAADIYVRLQNQMGEGRSRGNLTSILLNLGRHEDARKELLRALQCFEPYGAAAEIWRAWDLLHQLEQAAGDDEVAARARQNAFESYLSYRREGGYGRAAAADLCTAVAEAIAAGDTSELEQSLSQPLGGNAPPWVRAVFPKVLAVLRGERDPALAEDSELDYDDAVELMLLLEGLKARGG
ncbi:MAG TPA: tetratricopeptide repeat protein [Pyrinomonadaceae bacterium]|nr:tetratricopeptide repeat protein [Pyrinomonadaceae bacterium]